MLNVLTYPWTPFSDKLCKTVNSSAFVMPLQIPQVAASGLTGSRAGRRTGSSIDFQDYREYQPGDDLRFIDWGIYARNRPSDRETVSRGSHAASRLDS